ncbi:hypothetical protein [Photobacterium sp. GB-72]|uniref:hypothetical protein n=1 Tax=Photobacterium sp. GB-72 TaxID=2022105 RepID=UPI000D174462|nr:hypothetical protein [Photobacterium sp. GB-72]PSV28088.1 hypothetical protein C9J40_19605 [Photobacterium sp. GB-72]
MLNQEIVINKELKKLGLLGMQHQLGGKKIGGYIYVHKSIVNRHFRAPCLDTFDYDICRYSAKQKDFGCCEISLFKCIDWGVPEPVAERQTILKVKNFEVVDIVEKQCRPLIYHHKWLFECPSNSNIEKRIESKIRSVITKQAIGQNKKVSSQIGHRRFWEKWLKQNNIKLQQNEQDLRERINSSNK